MVRVTQYQYIPKTTGETEDFFKFSGKYIILCILKGISVIINKNKERKASVPTVSKLFRPLTLSTDVFYLALNQIFYNGLNVSLIANYIWYMTGRDQCPDSHVFGQLKKNRNQTSIYKQAFS